MQFRFPKSRRDLSTVAVLVMAFFMAACSAEDQAGGASSITAGITAGAQSTTLQVYKSPTCGCCEDWIDHMTDAGFSAGIHHPQDMNWIKTNHQIAPRYQSCHTAVSEHGYVFEGHVPAKLVRQFLDNPPEDALGLAVPGMPVGSPGMEMGDRFDPYQVLLLKKDGSSEVYAEVTAPEAQY